MSKTDKQSPEAVQETVQKWVDKLASIAHHTWKGNDAPNTHHFDKGSIVPSANVDLAKGAVHVSFFYTDNTVPHQVETLTPLTQLGQPGPNEFVIYDGVLQQEGSFVLGHREGLDETGLYARMVVEFKYTDANGAKHDLRFDGDL